MPAATPAECQKPARSGFGSDIPLVLIVLLAAVAYSNSFSGPFIFDDQPSVVDNPSIRRLWPIGRIFNPPEYCLTVVGRPLANLTLAINYAFGGLDVHGYHVVNLILHILAALTLYGVLHRTLSLPNMPPSIRDVASHLALAAAALWTVHPLQTESVTYIVQRTEALVGLFYFFTLYAVIRCAGADAPRAGTLWGTSAVLACLCGMASKEVMVSAPLVVALYDRIFLTTGWAEVWRRRRWIYVGMGATWLVLAALMVQSAGRGGSAGFSEHMTSWEYLRTQFGWIVHYLGLTFWPHSQGLDYGITIAHTAAEIVPYAVIVVGLAVGTLAAFRRQPWIGFLGVWFFAILAPSSSFVPLYGQTAAEHRMYLPLAAVVTFVVVGVWVLCEKAAQTKPGLPALAKALAVFAVVALAAVTWLRNEDYESELRIWNTAVEASPQNSRAIASRGVARRKRREFDAALSDFGSALRLDPRNATALHNRGGVYQEIGNFQAAIADYTRAIEVEPNHSLAYNSRGLVYQDLGRLEDAIADFSRAVEINPALAGSFDNRGRIYQKQEKDSLALEDFSRATELDPENYIYAFNRGTLYARTGRLAESVGDLSRVVRLAPRYPAAYSLRAFVYEQTNQWAPALADYDRILELQPGNADAWYGRARCHFSLKRYAEAQADLDEFLRRGGKPNAEFVESLAAKRPDN